MQVRFCESHVAEHLLILLESIGISRIRSCKHHQTESCGHGRRDAIFVGNKFQRDGLACWLQCRMNAAHQFLARRNVKMMEYVREQNEVVPIAKFDLEGAARPRRVADRHTTRPGSAFEVEFGDGYDFVLLTNIFHHFDVPTCEKLMRRVHTALKPAGKAITLEFVPNEDRVSPPVAAAFSLVMLAGTDAGDAYTFEQYEKMFGNVGFAKTNLHPVPDMPQQVLLSEK